MQQRFEELIGLMRESHTEADTKRVEMAWQFACEAHGSQTRKDGSLYVTHPLETARIIVVEMKLDCDSVIASLLHDTLEDTKFGYDDIRIRFGHAVAHLVEGVTRLTRTDFSTEREEQMVNLRKMFMAMSEDIRVLLIKLADRLHNMRTLQHHTDEKRRKKARETMEIYAPLAHRLGMQKIKWELEDTAIRYLDPVGCQQIEDELKAKESDYDALLAAVTNTIQERLRESDIEARIEGRVKHIYSIYRKMHAQQFKPMDEIYDMFALRVIVETVADCYNVLGQIHDVFTNMPGRFKDYISMPKSNMYQSLHTTVVGKEGTPFEVQIRTWDMHHTAEYGIAAHWKYKSGEKTGANIDEKLEWVRRLIENQSEDDAEDYISNLKVDLFADAVFVFTPRGDVKSLPNGATVIDFAYSVHSHVGHHMTGAKVNGKLVNFESCVLQNGDIVEIMTNASREGPSRDWLDICKTGEARSKIKQWFKRERRDENIAEGRQRLENELKRGNIPVATVTRNDTLPHLLLKLGYKTYDDLLAAVGYGGITANRAANRIRDELVKLHRLSTEREQRPQPTPTARPADKAGQGVIVAGIGNCLVKFARCCNPIPGDKIVGFTTKGYGVSIHRENCVNVIRDASGRWVDVLWQNDADENYLVPIHFIGNDRSGILADVAIAMNDMHVEMASVKAGLKNNGTVLIDMTVQVESIDRLQSILNRLRQIRDALEVKRL